MSRVRLVNGNMDTLVANINAQLGTPLSKDEVELLRKEQDVMNAPMGGSLSDPVGMLADAEGRFDPVPSNWLDRAKELCNKHQSEGGRFSTPKVPDLDIVIVIHPKREMVLGVNGEMVATDKYVVFARERGGNDEPFEIAPECYVCNNHANGKKAGPVRKHDCWLKRAPRPNFVPFMFAKAHGLDDAEDLAKELRSAWQADREQEEGTTDWGSQMEIPFSPDWQAGYLAGNPKAWNTLSGE